MDDRDDSDEIRSKIRRLLMAEWDPIGVSDIPEAADEYDDYIGGIQDLVTGNASEREISAYLRNIEIHTIEMVDALGTPLLDDTKRNAVASSLKNLIPK